MGCQNLQANMNIYLTKGDPTMSAPLSNAICVPLVLVTQKPTNGTAWADLNPCPLNACCNVWGQCGTTPQFCTKYDSPTGAPASAPAVSNGCVSSCGTKTTHVSTPDQFIKIGYYETWNPDRPCLHMDIRQMYGGDYTHIHWASAIITEDFDVDVSGPQADFELFKGMEDMIYQEDYLVWRLGVFYPVRYIPYLSRGRDPRDPGVVCKQRC